MTVSNFGAHLHEDGHTVGDNFEPKLLHFVDKGKKLDMLECLEINRINKSDEFILLNDRIDLNNSPLLNLF